MASSKSRPSTDIAQVVIDRLGPYVRPGQQLCVALSGGIDSIVLLHATVNAVERLNIPLPAALHVHHGLSLHADAWAAFCREACERLQVQLDVKRVQVHPDGDGVEAAARKVRHAAFDAVASDWLLLGHHCDDQAETVLLNLLRGAGVHGAAGMRERRGRLLRPLLGLTREGIVEYATRHGLTWIDDESNADTAYTRNFVRHDVLPVIAHRFPEAVTCLARSAQAFETAADLLDELAAIDFGSARRLDVGQLRKLSMPRASNLLAYYLRQHGVQIASREALHELLRQLQTAGADRQVRIVFGPWEVCRFHGQVWIEKHELPITPTEWHGEEIVAWGAYRLRSHATHGEGIAAEVVARNNLCFSARRGGETLQLHPNGPRRPLKDLLREAGIPPWRRKTLPLLFSGDELVWVAGIGIAAEYRCRADSTGFSIEFDGVTW